MPRLATKEIDLSMREFSRGVVGGVSERGISRVNWLAGADNLYGRPYRGMRVRPGSRDISTSYLIDAPHSLMGYYGGTNKLFVGASNKIYEAQATAYPAQTLPATHPAGSDLWSHVNLNGLLVTTQRGGSKVPLEYDGASWKELKLPKPASAPTFAANTNTGGVVDVGVHYYRLRWRHANGNSMVGPVGTAPTVSAPNQTVNINANLVPGSPRDDYLGWTLERTKVNGTVNGPFWFEADGTATTYASISSDAQLGYMVDDGLHGEPPHVDGVTAFAGLLWGWAGSSLYASMNIGDLEATGIANFDADDLYQITKDDGDTIQLCIVVIDELLILKRRSAHIISGVDKESFVLTSIVYADPSRGSEAGCAGPRAACVIGGKAYFWGESGGLFSYQRGRVQPEAWIEMGRYLDTLNTSAPDKIVLLNHEGNFMLAWYPKGSDPLAEDQIVYDARFKQWWHWLGWPASDVIELKGGLFNSATLVFCGDENRGEFGTIVSGSEILDDYILVGGVIIPVTAAIPPGTVTVGDVVAGDTSLLMSAAALATVVDGTFVIGGVRYHRCNVTLGSTIMSIAVHYKLWAAFDGFMDEKDATGQNGIAVPVAMETPWLDGGVPDEWKDLDRVSFSSESDQLAVSIAIATDPPGVERALNLTTSTQGKNWAADTVSDPDDLTWDVDDWAADAPATVASGVPFGTTARRFKFTVSASPTGDFRPTGLENVAVLLPDKETNL